MLIRSEMFGSSGVAAGQPPAGTRAIPAFAASVPTLLLGGLLLLIGP